jgi:NitT/TauT family transport system permease protein
MRIEAVKARPTTLARPRGSTVPVLMLVAAILAVWYAAVYPMNAGLPQVQNAPSFNARVTTAFGLERPVLPAPHQIVADLKASVVDTSLTREVEGERVLNRRNLVFHVWTTLSSALVGFGIGVLAGMALAIGIVHLRTLRLSLMPWIIASQTIPILAVAPIIIVVLGSVGFTGLVPKALISAYLCFFPVAIGMVKGLNSPETMQLDLMRTYNASRAEVFFKVRLPASLPYLFASLKVAVAISLVGAIVGELPTGAQAGLGARLLQGSYYGQTVQIWSALVAAALCAALLVASVAAVERLTARLMGARPEGQRP